MGNNEEIIQQGRKGYRLRRNVMSGNPYEPYNHKYFLWRQGYEEEKKKIEDEVKFFKGRLF